MSGSGSKRASKWDSKEDIHHYHHSSVNAKSASYYWDKEPDYYRDNEPESVRFNAESNARSRADNSYYSEQDEPRQQYIHRSGSRNDSRSRSLSRSPIYRARRDAGSYDRHKRRTRVSPLPNREFSERGGDQSSDYGWEDRKPRETKYHTDDFREHAMMKGARSSDYNADFPEDNPRREHLHNGVSDPRLRRHRTELTEEKEIQRRDGDREGEFHRSSNIPCKFFSAGYCRNGNHCRFSHHGGAERKQPQDNNFYRHDDSNHSGHNKWNDVERVDNGKFREIDLSHASKGISESKGNGSSWIDDMAMSPDWNYGVQSLKNPMTEGHGVGIVGQSSQSGVVKDSLVTNYDQRSSGMFSYGDNTMAEKPIAVSHQNYNNPVNIAPVQVFNQITHHHNVLPYQTSLTVEKPVPVQNTVTREQVDQITNISASIAQFLASGQPIPQLTQALQMPLLPEASMAVQPNQGTSALHTQSNAMSSNPNQLWGLGMSTSADGVPAVTASQLSNVVGIQTLALNPKSSEENGEKKNDAANIGKEGKKSGEDAEDAEKIVDEEDDDDDDGSGDEEKKKGKDPKGMRAFKFGLVEIVKELLKPAWKEGKMNKDGYKTIVKKVVEKVTGTMQNGNVPQTQDKIDHYLSASKPKLIKLVQAYISKVKKN